MDYQTTVVFYHIVYPIQIFPSQNVFKHRGIENRLVLLQFRFSHVSAGIVVSHERVEDWQFKIEILRQNIAQSSVAARVINYAVGADNPVFFEQAYHHRLFGIWRLIAFLFIVQVFYVVMNQTA